MNKRVYFVVTIALTFYLVPLFSSVDINHQLILMFIYPMMVFMTAFLLTDKIMDIILFSVSTAILFIPCIFIYFGDKAIVYIFIYYLISIVGSVLKRRIIISKKHL